VTQNDFDRFLMDEVSQIPPSKDMVSAATPWQSAMEKIMWGMALNTFKLEFFYLQYILPLLGSVLMYLGYRSLRKENIWFKLCWGITAFSLIWHIFWDVLSATPLTQAFEQIVNAPPLFWPLSIALNLFSLARFFFLRAGIRRAFTTSGGSSPKDWIGRAIAAHLASFAIALWSTLVPLTEPGTFFGPQIIDEWKWLYYGRSFAFIALQIYVLVCISRQTNALAGLGYEITPAPVRFTSRTVLLGIFAVVLLAIPPVSYLGSHVSMPEAQSLEQNLTEQREVTKNRLVSMGLPQELADILDESELDACAGAVGVYDPTYMGTVKFTDERVKHDNFAVEWAGDAQIRLSAWMVALPDHTTRIYYWFEYLQLPKLRLQEQFSLDPSGNYPSDDFSARLVWTENNEQYACKPEVHLAGGTTREELEASNWAGVIFREPTEFELERLGGRLHWQPWIDYSIPKKADTMQGYLSFSTDISRYFTHKYTGSLNDFFYYALRHQTGFLHYPFADMSDLGGTVGSYRHGPMDCFYGAVHFDTVP